jgi:hypothetical protein
VCVLCPVLVRVVQQTLEEANAAWLDTHVRGGAATFADGDVDLQEADYASFFVCPCPRCGGVLKPDVVFFGGEDVVSGREVVWGTQRVGWTGLLR